MSGYFSGGPTKRRRGRPWGSRNSQPPFPSRTSLTNSTRHCSCSLAVGVLYTMPSCVGRKLSISATVGGFVAAQAEAPHITRQPANSPAPRRAFAIPVSFRHSGKRSDNPHLLSARARLPVHPKKGGSCLPGGKTTCG